MSAHSETWGIIGCTLIGLQFDQTETVLNCFLSLYPEGIKCLMNCISLGSSSEDPLCLINQAFTQIDRSSQNGEKFS